MNRTRRRNGDILNVIWATLRKPNCERNLKPANVDHTSGYSEDERFRSARRNKRLIFSAGAATIAKIVSVIVAFISVPMTLHYLGAERYGMWVTMSSLVAMLSFADLGIGNGLLTVVAGAFGAGDITTIREAIANSYIVLSSIAALIVASFFGLYIYVPWFRIFNVGSSLAKEEAGPALGIFIICFALAVPTSIVQRVQMGLQQGFLANFWQCSGSLLSLLGVLIAIHFRAGLPWLVLAFVGSPLLSAVLNNAIFFGILRPDLCPNFSHRSKRGAEIIARTGLLFLVLQVVSALTYSSDNVIIAQILGPGFVSQFAVPERMFSIVPMIIGVAMTPLWPAYREALTRGDPEWIRKALRRSLLIAMGVASVVSIILIVSGPWILAHWIGGFIAPSFSLLLGLGTWKILEACGFALAMFLNGTNVVGFQVAVSLVTGISSICLEVCLVKKWGISGAVWATNIAFFLCAVIPYSLASPSILRKLGGRDA